VFNLMTARRRDAHEALHEAEEAAPGAGCEHHHHHDGPEGGGWLTRLTSLVVLALPLVAATFWSPDSYSSEFLRLKVAASALMGEATHPAAGDRKKALAASPSSRRSSGKAPDSQGASASGAGDSGGFSVADLDRLVEKSERGNYLLDLQSLFYVASDRELANVIEGLPVETTGQVVKDPLAPDRRLRLFRMFITCCVADARPMAIPIEFTGPLPEFREMGWYRVVGTVEVRDEGGKKTTVLKAQEWVADKAPRDRLLF
jgi:uncharacterized repeat protein (TIGR03943 family)